MKLTEKFNTAYKVEEKKEEKEVFGIIKEMKEMKWSKDNKSQSEACDKMMKLAEMDDKEANSFMEYMDDKSSEYGDKEDDMDEMDQGPRVVKGIQSDILNPLNKVSSFATKIASSIEDASLKKAIMDLGMELDQMHSDLSKKIK